MWVWGKQNKNIYDVTIPFCNFLFVMSKGIKLIDCQRRVCVYLFSFHGDIFQSDQNKYPIYISDHIKRKAKLVLYLGINLSAFITIKVLNGNNLLKALAKFLITLLYLVSEILIKTLKTMLDLLLLPYFILVNCLP